MSKKGGCKVTKVKINGKGVMELFKSDGMGAYLKSVGDAVAIATGHPQDYETEIYTLRGTKIAQVQIQEGNYDAYRNELEHNDLLHALGSVNLPSDVGGEGGLTQALTDIMKNAIE